MPSSLQRKPRKRVTIREVAQLANVSPTAVSMARANHPQISPETRQRVEQACRKLGYQGNRRRNHVDRIGFLLVGYRIEDPVNASLLQGLSDAANECKLRLEISSIPDATDRAAVVEATLAFASELGGLLLCGNADAALLEEMDRARIPVVVVGHATASPDSLFGKRCVIVAEDTVSAGRLATGRLIECGHRRIGFIADVLYPGLNHSRWLSGYASAHALAGLPLDPRLIQLTGTPCGDLHPIAAALLRMSNPPTAFVLPDVRLAWEFVIAMRQQGVEIPREAIVFHNNPGMPESRHMQGYPAILSDPCKLGEAAVWYLQTQMLPAVKPIATAEVLLPFAHQNLPQPKP